jgi:hypothetical protein
VTEWQSGRDARRFRRKHRLTKSIQRAHVAATWGERGSRFWEGGAHGVGRQVDFVRARHGWSKECEQREKAPGYRGNQGRARDGHPQPHPPAGESRDRNTAPIGRTSSDHAPPSVSSVCWNGLDGASGFRARPRIHPPVVENPKEIKGLSLLTATCKCKPL